MTPARDREQMAARVASVLLDENLELVYVIEASPPQVGLALARWHDGNQLCGIATPIAPITDWETKRARRLHRTSFQYEPRNFD